MIRVKVYKGAREGSSRPLKHYVLMGGQNGDDPWYDFDWLTPHQAMRLASRLVVAATKASKANEK